VNWVLDLDIKGFSMGFPRMACEVSSNTGLQIRRVVRLIQKWLNAGVLGGWEA